MSTSQAYYQEVGRYYDADAVDFEKRYWQNPVLQRIRQAFREEVKRRPFDSLLEVGIGPGFDLVHFAHIMPEVQCTGIDISAEMCHITERRAMANGRGNVRVAQGSVEHLEAHFPGERYDMIYVFFGALNTVDDLAHAAACLEKCLAPGGHMVLTFVNKTYVMGMLIELLKLRPKAAFSRLRKVWGGYSPSNFLASKCYSKGEVRRAFKGCELVDYQGFSILYPAWYYHGIHRRLPARLLRMLWNADRALQGSFLSQAGEYSLYVFRKA